MTGLYQNPCYSEACNNGVKCTIAEASYGYAVNQR